MTEASRIPLIDVGPLVTGRGDRAAVAARLRDACRDSGFFYVVGHGVDDALSERLESLGRRFFALPLENKLSIRMELGGRAWRGYFPVGSELTSGAPDRKEGLYFGAELDDDDPRVAAGTPLHGRNLFPAEVPELRETVLAYLGAMTRLGHRLMEGLALSLGLSPDYFEKRYTKEPLVLFRIFNYPSVAASDELWSVGEHTDYGLLTILRQDAAGGLELRSRSGRGFIEAPPIAGSFVCNIGDMLDRMTSGFYRSTPHRVKNVSGRDRLSFPFFFDPGWDAEIHPIDSRVETQNEQAARWDRASVHAFRGTYGEYLLGKVSRVFPRLRREVL